MTTWNILPMEVEVNKNDFVPDLIVDKDDKEGLKKNLEVNTIDEEGIELDRSTEEESLENEIAVQRKTAYVIPDEHPSKPGRLSNLSLSLRTRFDCFGDLKDIHDAVETSARAVSLTSDEHPDKPNYLKNLSDALGTRFERLGNLEDIHKAVETSSKAVSLTANDDPDKFMYLNTLGHSFRTRFDRLGEQKDIDDAVETSTEVVDGTPDGHPDKPIYLSNLSDALGSRFELLGNLTDVHQAVETSSKAVFLTSSDDPYKPMYLNTLSNALQTRFQHLGGLKDIHEAVEMSARAISLIPDKHPDRAMYLHSFSSALGTRFEHLRELKDINEAVEVSAEAVSLTPNEYSDKPVYLNVLGLSLLTRFERLGDLKDIHEAVETITTALSLVPDEHPDKAMYLHNLSNALGTRYVHLGRLKDIDESVDTCIKAVSVTADGNPRKPRRLSNLGLSLRTRFDHLGDPEDISKAIETSAKSVSLTPNGHPDKPMHLCNLSNIFGTRFERFKELKDINAAIEKSAMAISLTPDEHPDKPMYLNLLGISFQSRFVHLGDLKDINEAVENCAKSVCLIPDKHPYKHFYMINHAISLWTRFKRLKNMEDIDEAIEASAEAASLAPEGHPIKAHHLSIHGLSLQTRFENFKGLQDRDKAILSFQESATYAAGHPNTKIKSARAWAALGQPDIVQVFQAYHVFIDLLPQVAWLGSSIRRRYQNIQELIGDSINKAAASAIMVGKYDKAIEWLEQGRSIVWGQLLSLRTPLDDLREQYPESADSLKSLSMHIQQASVRKLTSEGQSLSLEQEAQKHRRFAEKRENLIAQIRSKPGFENFLKPKPFSQLKDAATNSPFIVINIESTRCDALVIRPGQSSVLLVPLSDCSLSALSQLKITLRGCLKASNRGLRKAFLDKESDRKGTQFEDVLSSLWSTIVQPVLDALGLFRGDLSGPLPHITWCPTGPLSSLPLHAAGIYTPTGPRIYNYVVSSYSPTLTALLPASALNQIPFTGILAVSQTQSGLKQTAAEVEKIQSCFGKDSVTWLHRECGTVNHVLQQMASRSWVHFACHAKQKDNDPTESAFILHDGSLSLTDIMRKSFKGDFAFLSACETATGDENLPEESLHLAASMMMSGYPSVIATLWAIRDEDAPIVAREVYSRLYNKGKPDRKLAARALHDAVAHLRGRQVKDFLSWVPFIHMGA